MAQKTGGEHRVQIQARGAVPVDEATPEKQLNSFVRFIALVERVGNALGTLAFTWATVILLGGYPTVLRPEDDFWFATAIVFLEAARMFSRNNRLDYQVFFYTRGAVRPVGWNGLLVILCLSNVLLNVIIMVRRKKHKYADSFLVLLITMLILAVAIRQILSLRALIVSKTLRRSASLWSPLVAIILLVPAMLYGNDDYSTDNYAVFKIIISRWTVFLLLFLIVLLLTVSRLRYPRIIKLLDSAWGRKLASWRRITLNCCIIAAMVMVVFVQDDPVFQGWMMGYEVYALILVSFGNLQIPVAIGRVVLALLRLVPHDYFGGGDAMKNLGPSLCIFYGMVLGQGTLYIIACLIEIFSLFPRRSLARRVGFRSQWGVECINLYYAYAFEKYMNGDVFAPKMISLNSFAMDSLHSDSPKMQFHGVRIMHGLLQRELSKTRTFSKLSTSTETMARLIKMMDWTSPEDSTVRLFATKVTAELSKSLRVTTIPGTLQIVSALLNNDTNSQHHKRGNPLQDSDDEQEEVLHDSILKNAADNIEEGRNLLAVSDSSNLHEAQQDSTDQHKCWILRCWQRISEPWAIPQEEPLTEQDILPALGMKIIGNLAGYDQDNCLEISRASGLIRKIIGFTRYCGINNTTSTGARPNVLARSSLKLLRRLTSIDGEIGTTLRHSISRHPFLFRNLAEILRDSRSSPELRKVVAGILRNLAVDVDTRQAIGRIQVIINGLMQTFLMPDGPSITAYSDPLLRKVAGQALAMLAMDSIDNCLAMLRETGFVFIKELTGLIHFDRYRCVSASLLRSMCLNARDQLQESDLKELSHTLREVLERILVAEDRTELEILVGLSSQICKAVPDDFARELEHGQIKETFVKWLVDTLNMNTELSDGCCHGISRSILEQAINMMEYDSGYATYFNEHHMSRALSMVEETASAYVNYNIFLGDAGLMEGGEPLSPLVERAKMLLAFRRI